MCALISLEEELVEVMSNCILVANVCKVSSTHEVSNHVVNNFDPIFYHNTISQTKRLHSFQGLQRHHVAS